ncbi:MAG: CotH kinase family protein [Saprospiraceae bacterium]|nr:CotH kinase family protein [Saprospiraceae bacterium]
MKLLLPALCLLVTQLFAQNPGDAFFTEGIVHEIRFQFNQPGYFDSLKANYALDVHMRCDVTVDGVPFPTSGVKYKGNSSYNNPSKKKPFRIDFEEYIADQELDGMDKIVLNNAFKDPTFLREKLMLDFLNDHQIPAPRASFAKLYINNHYWGLYSVVEDVNKTFLKTHFDNKSGNLFKGDPRGTLVWKGADPGLYQTDYELKTNETENDWSDLIHLLDVLNNTPNAQLPDSLSKYLNLDNWFSYWAAHNLFVNLDSYVGSGHNYFLYHNKDTDKFEWISWDVNEAFGNFQMGISLANIKVLPIGHIPQPMNQRPIMNRLWTNATLKQQYIQRYCALINDFSNAKMDGRIDELANLIRPHVYADTLKFYTNNQFEQNLNQDMNIPQPGASGIAGLKPFISARRASLLQQLAQLGCTPTAADEPEAESWVVFPNPADESLNLITQNDAWEWAEIYDASGKLMTKEYIKNNYNINFNLASFATGWYVIRVTGEQTSRASKFLVSH